MMRVHEHSQLELENLQIMALERMMLSQNQRRIEKMVVKMRILERMRVSHISKMGILRHMSSFNQC